MSPSAPAVVVPFILRFDHILLDARINGTPATLVLDTGSGACSLDAEWAAELGLAPGPEVQAMGVDSMSIPLATMNTLQVGDAVVLHNEIAALVPLRDVSARHGYRIHGTVGFPFFAKYVVEIDYAARVLRLHDPLTFVHDGPGERIALDLSMRVPVLHAEFTGTTGASIPARLLLDLGTGEFGSLLTKPFVDRNAEALIGERFVEQSLGTGVGGSIHGRVATLAALHIGSLRVPNPIVGMPSSGRGFFGLTWVDGTLGAPILRRTRVILDYAHKQVTIQPVEAMDAPFPYNGSGLSLCASGPELGAVVIDEVTPGSAGARAGLLGGEILHAIDGQPVSAISLEWVDDQLTRVGAAYSLRVERGGAAREVLLRLESNGLR